jgi:hypothetical protein
MLSAWSSIPQPAVKDLDRPSAWSAQLEQVRLLGEALQRSSAEGYDVNF